MPFLLLSLTLYNLIVVSLSVRTNIHKVLFLLLLTIFIFSSCNKNEEDNNGWENCFSCTVESWVGEYSGTGDYSNYDNSSEMNGVDVSITIEETATDYLTIYFNAPNVYSTTVSGDLSSPYIVSFAGSGSSVIATMFINEGELRLTGNSKKFHYVSDTVIVIDQVITFETNKIQ